MKHLACALAALIFISVATVPVGADAGSSDSLATLKRLQGR